MTSSLRGIWSQNNFRLLFASSAISLLGSQFTLIAIPWLVLQITKDPLALGTVLAIEGALRAVFVILGGAFCDRLSPKRMMLITDLASCLLIAAMAWVLWLGSTQIGWFYAFAVALGITSGLALPATNSILPFLVKKQDLEAGNSLIMGITQLTALIGPAAAGILLATITTSSHSALAFALNAASFAVSAVLIWLIQWESSKTAPSTTQENIFASIWVGAKHLWEDQALRSLFLMLLIVNFLLMGPLLVGIPLLASERLPEGASAFGLLMSSFAGGGLVGSLVAGSLPRPSGRWIKHILILFIFAFGLVMVLLGFLASTWIDCLLLFLVGGGNGYLAIFMLTWLQTRAPEAMLGRWLSLLTFSSAGFLSISQISAGLISAYNPTLLFVLSGALVVLVPIPFFKHLKRFADAQPCS